MPVFLPKSSESHPNDNCSEDDEDDEEELQFFSQELIPSDEERYDDNDDDGICEYFFFRFSVDLLFLIKTRKWYFWINSFSADEIICKN